MPAYVRKAIVRVFAWLVLSGSAVGFYALWTRDSTHLTSRVVARNGNEPPERIWATSDVTFAGYRARSGLITLWSITATEENALTALRTVSAPDAWPSSVTVSRNLAKAFWLASNQLVSYDLQRQAGRRADVASLEANSILQMSDSGTGVIVGPSGAIQIFRGESLKILASGTIAVRNADLVEASGPFVAIAERATGSVAVVDTRITSKIGLTESRTFGARITAMSITGAGTLAVATASGSIWAKEQLGAPGIVRGLQYYDDRSFLVAGDFAGAHLIPFTEDTQEISQAEPGARSVATSSKYFLLAYPDHFQLHALRYATVVHPKAKNLFRIWIAATVVILFFAFLRVLIRLFRRLRDLLIQAWGSPQGVRSKPDKIKHVPEIGEPPSDLLASAADRSIVIFVGEELSRLSGMPPWRTFVLGLIDRLYDALLLPSAQADAARQAHREGRWEEVARGLAPVALGNRQVLNDFARSMYCKAAALTKTHEALSAVGASAVVTPNLDALLERCFSIAPSQAFAPSESGDAVTCLLRNQFVAMKLRGVFDRPETLHIWPSEAQAVNARDANVRRFLAALLMHRSMLILGTSVDEIEAWLEAADLQSVPTRKHYALIPRGEGYTVKLGKTLSDRFNIECIAYPPDNPETIIQFLSQLSPKPKAAVATSPSKT